MRVDIFHNIMWPRYKAMVFTQLHRQSEDAGVDIRFFQIAHTEAERRMLGELDLSYHQYPYTLLFRGDYEAVPLYKRCLKLFGLVMRSDADLVVIPGYHLLEYWFMLVACMLRGVRRGVFVDSTRADHGPSRLKDGLKRFFLSRADQCFCYGTRSREYLLELGVREDRITSGCQAAALPQATTLDQLLARRIGQARPPGPVFLFAGVLETRKGVHLLLEAFTEVRKKYPAAQLVLVGDGSQKEMLRAQAASLGLASAVSMPGSADIDRLSEWYLKASVFVLPSVSEPWGLVVNEALQHGCPAVVSDKCGCASDLVIDGDTGYSFRSGDVADLSAKLLLAAERFAERAPVARRCVAHIRNYTPARAAGRILDGIHRTLRVVPSMEVQP